MLWTPFLQIGHNFHTTELLVPVRRSTLACGIVFGCVSSGVLLATSVSTIVHASMTAADVEAYGWRIGFLIGGLLGVVSWMLRRSLEESPAFLRMRQRALAAGSDARNPPMDLLVRHRARILFGIGATCVVATFNGLLFAQMPAFLVRTLNHPGQAVAPALNIASGRPSQLVPGTKAGFLNWLASAPGFALIGGRSASPRNPDLRRSSR